MDDDQQQALLGLGFLLSLIFTVIGASLIWGWGGFLFGGGLVGAYLIQTLGTDL